MENPHKPRLRRSLSAAKRCDACGKMIYLNVLKCKNCRISLHDSCALDHSCDCFLTSIDSNMVLPVLHCGQSKFSSGETFEGSCSSNCSSNRKLRLKSTNISDIYSKMVSWLTSRTTRRRNSFRERDGKVIDEKHVRGRFGLQRSETDSKVAKRKFKILLRNASVPRNQTFDIPSPDRLSNDRMLVCVCGESGRNMICYKCGGLRQTTAINNKTITTNTSPGDHLPSSGFISASSSFSRTPSTERYDQSGNCNTNDMEYPLSVNLQQRLSPTVLLPQDDDCHRVQITMTATTPHSSSSHHHHSSLYNHRTSKLYSNIKARTLSLETKNSRNHNICATWPPTGRHVFNFDDSLGESTEVEESSSKEQSDNLSQCAITDCFLGEWTIPFEDLKRNKRLRHGRHGSIYSGWWHGDVMIHTFDVAKQQCDVQKFMEDVAKLSMIRHENIMLFMGVSINPTQQAIVTSMRKGASLYEHIHREHNKLSLHAKVNILRQVAQGMGYLHAKGIIHKKLNSKNIFLESKVKICFMDNGMAESELDQPECGCVPNGHLTYVSCEMMRTLTINTPNITPNIDYTKESDIFAFGTVLYELVAECWPFRGQHVHSIIWQVSSGHTQDVSHLKCPMGLKSLILKCWDQKPQSRPPFSQTVKLLMENVTLHKRHSSSEPESMNRVGLVRMMRA